MANIKVKIDYPISDGTKLRFRTPCESTSVEGLVVTYPVKDGVGYASKTFTFADANGNELSGVGNVFTADVLIGVFLDVTKGRAYIKNADTNSYIENIKVTVKRLEEERQEIFAEAGRAVKECTDATKKANEAAKIAMTKDRVSSVHDMVKNTPIYFGTGSDEDINNLPPELYEYALIFDKNDTSWEDLAKAVSTNAENIDANANAIEKNANAIETNTENIGVNAKDIEAIAKDIETNADNINVNAQCIEGNAQAIETNATNIEKISVDYIVERGTVDDWHYTKWNSGVLECIGKCHYDFSNSFDTLDFGYSRGFYISLPSGLFNATPNTAIASVNIFGSAGVLLHESTKDSLRIWLLSAVKYNDGQNSCSISLHILGTWKEITVEEVNTDA